MQIETEISIMCHITKPDGLISEDRCGWSKSERLCRSYYMGNLNTSEEERCTHPVNTREDSFIARFRLGI
jgi:hypothetical protein